MNITTLKTFFSRKRYKELGVSLVEALVYVVLFTILAVLVVSVINTTISSGQRITNSSTTQTEINQAASMLQREISLANSFTYASQTRVDFNLRQNDANQKVSVFAYIPGNTTSFPAGVQVSQMPPHNAIMRVVYLGGSETPSKVEVLLSGYDPVAYSQALFSFYDSKNAEIIVEDEASSATRNSISRVEYHLAANVAGRNTPVQLESSAVPIFDNPAGVADDFNVDSIPECPANFASVINARDTHATLTWNAPAGAVSYTVYRYNMSESGIQEGSTIIPDPGTTSLSNSGITTGLAWGTTYRFTIQAAGAAGVTSECADTSSTVVPDQLIFVNVNSLAADLVTTNPSASLTMSFPSNGGETTKSQSTSNLASGYRYTVARGLINQLAWESEYGSTTYSIYVNGQDTPFATITGGETFYQDTNSSRVNYGNITSYVVSASNAGGEGFRSAPISLISPPSAPVLQQATGVSATPGTDPVRPDTSVTLRGTTYSPTSTTTVNRIIVSSAPSTALAYRTYAYSGNTAATTNCAAAVYTADLNFVTTGAVDDSTPWGSYDCYSVAAINDAGIGLRSDNLEIKQYPGPFALTGGVTSGYYNFLDLSRPNWGDGKCWVDARGVAQSPYTCLTDTYAPYGNGPDVLPNGLFDKIADTYTDVFVSWGRSLNATGGYDVERHVLNVKCGDVSKTDLTGCPYPGTANHNFYYTNDDEVTAQMRYEMPGAAYEYTVKAKSAAGTERANSGNRVMTNPDIPSRGETHYERNRELRRATLTVLKSVRLGNSSTISLEFGKTTNSNSINFNGNDRWSHTGTTLESNNNNSTYLCTGGGSSWGKGCPTTAYTNPLSSLNHNARSYQTNWTWDGSTVKSRLIWKTGAQTKSGIDAATSWKKYPDTWYIYWTGAHAGYWSGWASRVGEVIYHAGVMVPPADLLASGEEALLECNDKEEWDANFTFDCTYGTGIPAAPSGIAISTVDYDDITEETTYEVVWDEVPGAEEYLYAVDGGTPVATTTRTATVVVPSGDIRSITVATVNTNNTSAESVPLTLYSQTLDVLTLDTTTTPTNVNLSWNSLPTATSYEIYRSIDEEPFTLIATRSDITYEATWNGLSGQRYEFYVIANNATNTSTSNTVQLIAELEAPELNISGITAGSISLSWTATGPLYEIEQRINGGPWVHAYSPVTTGHTLSWNGTSGDTYEYRVRALTGYTESPWSNIRSAVANYTPPPPTVQVTYVMYNSPAMGYVTVTVDPVAGATYQIMATNRMTNESTASTPNANTNIIYLSPYGLANTDFRVRIAASPNGASAWSDPFRN